MRSMLVIGLGRFGSNLALRLMELGNEVMVLDKDEDRVTKIADSVTASHIGDCMDADVLKALGIKNFDVCFVCVSDDFQCSLEATSTLKELGAKFVVSKADREAQTKFLKKIGADLVVHTERDMAQRIAIRFSAKNTFDYIELSPEYAIFEIDPPADWVGRTIAQVGVRGKYAVNILGVKLDGHIKPLLSPDYVFKKDEHLLIAGEKTNTLNMLTK